MRVVDCVGVRARSDETADAVDIAPRYRARWQIGVRRVYSLGGPSAYAGRRERGGIDNIGESTRVASHTVDVAPICGAGRPEDPHRILVVAFQAPGASALAAGKTGSRPRPSETRTMVTAVSERDFRLT